MNRKYRKVSDITKWTVAILTLAMAVGPLPLPFFGGVPLAEAAVTCGAAGFTYNSASNTCRGFIISTSTTSWVVPGDWDNSTNTIEVIGGGGGGGGGNTGAGSGSGSGGGGGAYAKISNLTLTVGGSVTIQVGAAGGGGAAGSNGTAGTATFFQGSTCAGSSVCGDLGSNGLTGSATGGAGGTTANSVGTTKFAGGSGGGGSTTAGTSGGGGGGAAGLNGAGTSASAGPSAGGSGDAGSGGGGGAAGNPASAGSGGAEYDATHGSGGGGGGGNAKATTATGGTGGAYGAGGGGGGGKAAGGNGQSGLIVITYRPRTITLTDGSQPASRTIGPTSANTPGSNATTSAVFSFATNVGTSTISSTTVSLSTSTGIYQVLITSSDTLTVYGSSTNPSATTFDIPFTANAAVSSTATTFKILVSPLSYATMPSPSNADYAVTSTLAGWHDTVGLSPLGSNTTSSVITIDNSGPSGTLSNASGTASTGQVALSWTNPSDTDYATTTVFRTTSTLPFAFAPRNGTYYTTSTTIGTGTTTVACVSGGSPGSTGSCTDTNVVNGTAYNYSIWTADTFLNYSTASTTPTGSPFTPAGAALHTQRSSRWQNDDGANVNSDTNMEPADTAVTSTYIGQRLTLRMQIDNTGGADSGMVYSLQYQANSTSGTWTDVASGNAIEPALGTAGNNNDAITSAVAATNSNTFTNGAWTEGTNAASSTKLLANYYTEEAYMVETSKAASGTTYYFRVASGTSAIDAYSVFPSLQTVSSTGNTLQYSKRAAGAAPSGTSSLQYFFDSADYTAVTASDTTYAAITATSTNAPVFLFKSRASTSTFPVRVDWTGQESAASTTYIDIYDRVAQTWVNLASTSSPPVNTNFTLTGNATTSPARFYDGDAFGNFWTYVRVRQNTASTTATLKTGQIAVNFEPAANSAAGQTFTVNDSPTAMSQITITASPDTPVVATSTGIRLMVPTSLNMLWATSTTSATLGGTAAGKTSSTVSYLDGGRTLKINVTSTYATGDTLTISGLNFANFTGASASATLWAFYDGATGTVPDAVDSFGKIVRGMVNLNNHPAGQETNQLNVSQTSLTQVPLLDFQVTSTGETATTTQIVFNLSNVTGFGSADITNASLTLDTNANGVVDAGETTNVGGPGTVSISNGQGTITFSGSFAVTSTMNLILSANISNNNPGNGFTISLTPSGLSASGNTSLVALSQQGTAQSATHGRQSTKGGGTGPSGGGSPSVSNTGGGGSGGSSTPSGGGSPSGGNTSGGGAGGGAPTP